MKLSSIKHYKVVTSLENYNKNIDNLNHVNICNLKFSEDNVVFFTNQYIELDGFEINDQRKLVIKKVFLSNIILFFLILSIILMMFITPYYIKELKYKDGSIIDESVYNDVIICIKDKEKLNLRNISKELMIKYSHYSWIELKKQGRVLYLYIELNQVRNNQNKLNNLQGDLISGYDAYIKSIIVTSGKLKVDINQTVKKGDLLVSGNINNQLMSSSGEVIGEVVYTKVINVKKELLIESYSGEMISFNYFKIGNYNFKKKKNQFINYRINQKTTFNLFNTFFLIHENIFEIKKYVISHTNETAMTYAKSLVHYDMEKSRTSKNEKILSIDLLELIENDNEYILKFLVKADKNIVVFRQY